MEAINRVGDYFYSGFGVSEPNVDKSKEYYEKAASMGSVEALLNLGAIYEKIDKNRALDYYQ